MAQAATMGPPLSPREPRRSGRRSVPSTSTSASKSPDSDPAPRHKEILHRPPLASNNSSGRQKRLKQEDYDDPPDERKNGSAASTSSGSSTHGASNGRTKRKAKENKQLTEVASNERPAGLIGDPPLDAPEEEEQGITRCVCGSTGEDDPDAGEFMVQCETCKVWQHGLCMGYESEDQLHDDDYYCEQCRPELHPDILNRKRSRRPRQTSTNSHLNPTSATSRVSRSHSPSTLLKQPSKRRNTMNSRDAAFDESLKEIIEATAAEAAAQHDNISVASTGNRNLNGNSAHDEDAEPASSSRKKRKRTEEDSTAKKRTRSTSCTSDHLGSIIAPDDAPGKGPTVSAPALRRSNKRGGRKTAAAPPPLDSLTRMDGEDGLPTASKRQGNSRGKGPNSKRPPASHSTSQGPGSALHEHGTRRNQTNSVAGANTGPSTGESSRAYRNSHAYVVSQQPLFTSWNLPDYLAHLEEMLPTDTPRPLEVPVGSGLNAGNITGRGDSLDRTVERGVKVKWPSKRTSVGDMNKRVRALVEWVGREQAAALDRMRRREALEKALREELQSQQKRTERRDSDPTMTSDGLPPDLMQDKTFDQALDPTGTTLVNYDVEDTQSSSTMKKMEELMEELISFQERFGPAAKNRERRLVSS